VSGGSYNYLYIKVEDGLSTGAPGVEDLARMADRLEELGWADDIAHKVRSAMFVYEAADESLKLLSEIFACMEWWDSSDSDEEPVKRAIAKHRGEI
jgi:hypothetical protein